MVANSKNRYLLTAALLVMLFLMASNVSAALFVADYKAVKAGITPEDVAEYTLTIENFEDSDIVFSLGLKPSDTAFWISSPSSVNIPALSQKSFSFKLFPKSNVGLGTYRVPLRVQTSDGTQEIIELPVSVSLDAFDFNYLPDVALNVVVPQSVDPRNKLKLEVLLKNRNMLDIENLVVEISGDLFYHTFNESLGPRKEKTRDVSFNLNPLEEAGTQNFDVRVIYSKTGSIVAEAKKEFDIKAYSRITVTSEIFPSLFLTREVITLENDGNAERSKEVSIVAPWTTRIFTTSEPKGEVVEIGGETRLQWNPSLKPTETKEITIVRNYRSLAVIVLVIILLIIAYFLFRSPVLVIKEAAVVGEDEEGFSEVKVRVFIRNRSRNSVHNISVTDRIPRITNLIETSQMGSLKPTRVTKNTKRGTILYWDLERLESFEERILTYRIKSNLKIVGDVTMPRVRVKFETPTGRERSIISSVPLFIRQ